MRKSNSEFWYLVLFFVLVKTSIHLLTNTNYELHRDAFLYIAQGDHLSWGFLSVPPLTAFLGKIVRLVFGDSVFAVRLFPTIIGGASVVFINLIVREMGGRKLAQILASIAFIFSPAFLRSNLLFQPVSLNQFLWLTAFYLIIRLLRTQDPRYWLLLAINFGLGFLTKYSIVFLAMGFFTALLILPNRRLILSRYFIYGLIIGILIVLPNLIWQYQNSWPVVYHMDMLRQYHLVNVQLSDFLIAQLIMNLPVTFFWLTGLFFLLFHPAFREYKIVGIIYVLVILLLIFTRGKSYYTIGLYGALFAAGGVVFEQHIKWKSLVYVNILFMVLITSLMLPFSLPVLGHEKMLSFCQRTIDRGIDMPMRWEDGEVHDLPQDYADMIGWEELGMNVIKVYESLSPADQKRCYIYGENYGEAGAIRYYGIKRGLPEPISFHGSFIFWSPENVDDMEYLIYVNDEIGELTPYFKEIIKYDGITNPYSRESGLPVWLCKHPNDDFRLLYEQRLQEELDRFMKNP